MKLFQPFKNAIITQRFGKENTSTDPEVQQWYKDLKLLGHNGLDFSGLNCNGKPIFWNCDIEGDVIQVFTNADTKGAGVYINTSDSDGDFMHVHWHLQPNIQCGVGKIQPGQLIGYVDNTGQYTKGSHDHYGLYKYPRDLNNGYGGAMDPIPYYNPIFILTYLNMTQQISIYKKIIDLLKQLLDMK